MAGVPIVRSSGSASGVVTGFSREDLDIGETVTLTDTNAGNTGAAYQWALEDRPPGSSASITNPTQPSASFVPDVTGSYRIRCTINGSATFFAQVILAVPLPTTEARIPSFGEKNVAPFYNPSTGNTLGYHPAIVHFMRRVDELLAGVGTTLVFTDGLFQDDDIVSLEDVITSGTAGSSSAVPVIQWNSKGQLISVSTAAISTQAYKTVQQLPSTTLTQRDTLAFSTAFSATDSSSPARTQVDLANNGVTLAKIAQGTGLSVLGVGGPSGANYGNITGSADQVLRVSPSGASLAFGSVATAGLANSAVTYGKFQDSSVGLTVLGRSANSTGAFGEIAATAAGNGVLRESGSTLAFGTLVNAHIDAAAAIAHTKLANLAGASVLGRSATGSGAMAAITGSTIGHVLTVQGDNTLAFSAPASGGANALGTYLVQTATNAPANAQVLGTLPSGILKVTTSTGVVGVATPVIDYEASLTASLGVTRSINDFRLASIAGLSVLGVTASSTATPAAITAATSGHVLRYDGTNVAFGTLASGAFADNTITLARLANGSARSVVGRSANSSGAYAGISGGGAGTFLKDDGTTLSFAALAAGDIPLSTGSFAQGAGGVLAASSTLTVPNANTLQWVGGGAAGVFLVFGSTSTALLHAQSNGTASNGAVRANAGNTSSRAIELVAHGPTTTGTFGGFNKTSMVAVTDSSSATAPSSFVLHAAGATPMAFATNDVTRFLLTGAGNYAFGPTISSGADATNYQSMVGGSYWKNATTEPGAAPSGGGYLWWFGGALKAMGGSGVPVTLAN